MEADPTLAPYIEPSTCECDHEEPGPYNELGVAETMRFLNAFATTQGLMLEELSEERWRHNDHVGIRDLNMCTLSSYLISMAPNLRRLECFGRTIGEDDLLMQFVDTGRVSTRPVNLPLQHLQAIQVKLD